MYIKKSPPVKDSHLLVTPEKIQLLIKNQDFQDTVALFRREFDIPEQGFDSLEEMSKYFEHYEQFIKPKMPAESLKTPGLVLGIIMVIFQVPEYYQDFLIFYILMGWELSFLIEDISIKIEVLEDKYGHPYLQMKMPLHVRKRDVTDKWNEVNELQRKLNVSLNNKSHYNLERDSEILNLKKQGLSHKEIWKEINKKFPDNRVGDYANISVLLARIKEYLHNIT